MGEMSDRNEPQQRDLLRWATMDAERQRLLPEIEATVIQLLKRLLDECVTGKAVGSEDE
jgi:hypothetical protein